MARRDYIIFSIILAVILIIGIIFLATTIGAMFDEDIGIQNWYVWITFVLSIALIIISGMAIYYYIVEKLSASILGE